jgi:hypothetical protein
MDTNKIDQQVSKFEKARNNLLAVIAFTVINLILIGFNADVSFLFSASLPQFVFQMGRIIDSEVGSNIFMIIGLVIAFIIIIPYFVFWILAKRKRALILAALIYFCLDSLVLLFLILDMEFNFSLLLEIVFHVWILYYLIDGVKAWTKIRGINTNDLNIIHQEIKSKNIYLNESETSDESHQEINGDNNSTNE